VATTKSHPNEIEPGDRIQLRTGADATMALVEAALPASELRVRVSAPVAEGSVVVRWLDAGGTAWRVPGIVALAGGDATALTVELEGEWQRDAMRASQRISGTRHSLRGEVQAGSLPPGTRLDLVCLDISASGCRASGVGRLPAGGDLVRLCLVHPFGGDRWATARVMRVSSLAFGRYEVGFRFEVDSTADRAWLAGWRDAWAYAGRDEPADDEPVAEA
jgi:hypothetical protein